jgi:hypothetical protein
MDDPRWSQLVACHPRASVFHTRGWLDALKRTYQYTPIAFTTCPPGAELRSAVVFCEIQSWLTGSRLVSLPFSDHCDPLTENAEQLATVIQHAEKERKARGWRYIELRPLSVSAPAAPARAVSEEYVFHTLALRQDIDALFRAFHRSSTQRKILRARREGVTYEEGRHADMLRAFYRLLVVTRRRHGLPPQPFAWFSNLAECLGEAMTVRIASHRGQPVASIVTIRHGSTMMYKYGASDAGAHPLGAVHHLFWKTIQDAVVGGCISLDLGRTDLSDDGLSTFKERWGAKGTPLYYWRCPVSRGAATARDWMASHGTGAARRIPAQLQVAAGRMLYRHLG